MKCNCENFQQQIPQALLNDLSVQEKALWESHLAECPVCRHECELYTKTLAQLNADIDLPVRKHFFVNPPAPDSPWNAWSRLSLSWKSAVLAAAVLVLTLTGLISAKTKLEVNQGGFVLAFGQNIQGVENAFFARQTDIQNLRHELTVLLDQKSSSERLELIRIIKTELTQGNRSLSPAQQKWVLTSLGKVENRLNQQILTAGTLLQARNEQTVTRLTESLSRQRDKDLTLIDASFRSLAQRDALKNEQTDAILDTLIQVAELKMVPNSTSTTGKE